MAITTEDDTSASELLVRVNGIQPAFGTEFGLQSPRNNEVRRHDPYRQANVSYSLVQREADLVLRHTLVDVGMGVVPSLLEFEESHGVHMVNELLLTHHHFDHFIGLDWLCACLYRNGQPDQPRPLKVYASQSVFEHGPLATFPHLAEQLQHVPIEDGRPLQLGDMAVTPFGVQHSREVPGAMGFVAQHADRKIIISGDFRVVTDEDNPLLRDADVCFLDTNTWHPTPHGNHSSLIDNLRLIERWRPQRTYLVHYSGYEDRDRAGQGVNGPLAAGEFRAALDRLRGPHDVRIAEHGMILGDNGDPY